jgi:hypothetical protein
MLKSQNDPLLTQAGSRSRSDRIDLYAPEELTTDAILRPTPLLRMWQDWAHACCIQNQPVISLFAGLTAFSAVMGGAYRGPTYAVAPLMTLVLAPPGGGKDGPQDMCRVLMEKIGMGERLAAEAWGSAGGLEREISEKVDMFAINDEFADVLAGAYQQNAPSYKKDIARILKVVYSGKPYRGTAIKDGEATLKCEKPRVAVFGAAQPQNFWESCPIKAAIDGMLSRITICTAYIKGKHDHKRVVKPPDLTFPADMGEWIKAALPVATTSPAAIGGYVNEVLIGYENEAAQLRSQELFDHYEAIKHTHYEKNYKIEASVIARSYERCVRLAAVYAWTEKQKNPTVSIAALEWAKVIVDVCDRQVLRALSDNSNEDPSAKRWGRYQQVIEGAGQNGICSSVLISRTKFSQKDHESILKQMMSAGVISVSHGKRGGAYYVWTGVEEGQDAPEDRTQIFPAETAT